MQIFVRTLDDRTLTFDVQPDNIIEDVKELVEQREGIPVEEQRLTLGGITLNDELTLDECHIEDESTLYVLLDLEGGGKKRKKKSYNTPKKNKHKRKKVKLAVLKYYKVEDTGKIHRLRRECPSKQCGAGVFMAAHHDRNYCGVFVSIDQYIDVQLDNVIKYIDKQNKDLLGEILMQCNNILYKSNSEENDGAMI